MQRNDHTGRGHLRSWARPIAPAEFAGFLRGRRRMIGQVERQRARADRAEAELADTQRQLWEAQQVAEELATYLGALEHQRGTDPTES